MRGKCWGIQKVHKILSDSLYMGDYYFNVIDSKAKEKRPPTEWVKTSIPAIIDAAVFDKVRTVREQRAPDKTPPRVLSSPNLLTGLLKCGICGGSMTLATGKSGRYKYYKCTSRKNKGNHICTSGSLPMQETDQIVLEQLANRAFAPERLQHMMRALRQSMGDAQSQQQANINQLNRQLKHIEERQHRLLDAIEAGVLDLDDTVQDRAQKLKTAKQALIIELATTRKQPVRFPIESLRTSQLNKLSQLLKQKLLHQDSTLAKSYLNLLISEIVVNGKLATARGSYLAIANLAASEKTKVSHLKQVPTFIHDWRARRESNPRPLASETNTLSS